MKEKKIDVIGQMNGANFEWQLGGDVSGNGPAKDKRTDIGKDSGPHYLTYKITGAPAQNVIFAQDAISVATTSAATKTKSSHSQIAWKVKSDGKELMVFDWNSETVDLYYQLNFVGAPSIDPIIQNGGGGGGQPNPKSISAAILVASAAAFFLGMFAYRVFFASGG